MARLLLNLTIMVLLLATFSWDMREIVGANTVDKI